MFKVTIFYEPFDGSDAFDAYYLGTHMPIARKVPGLLRDEVTVLTAAEGAAEPPYHLITELYFESEAAWKKGMDSEAGRELEADAKNFPDGVKYGGMLVGLQP